MGVRATMWTFWCGWEADDDIPDEHRIDQWPAGMKGWQTGFTERFTTWCARVDAPNAEKANEIIRSCYGESGPKLRMRWEPEKNWLGYRPPAGRFPE